MTYTIHFTDNTKPPFSIDPFRYDGPGAINGQHTSLTLLGKGYSDYGQEMWTNLVHMLENHSDSMPPAVSIEGQLWYDNSSVSNLKICKKAQGGGYKWIDVVDTETLQKLLYSSDFFSESILQSNVRVPSGLATIDGDIHIKGKLVVDRGIFSNKAPSSGNEVVTLSYLSSRLTSITSKYVPLKLPAGTTTIDGKLGSLSVGGDLTVTGTLTVPKDPTQQTDATNKKYVDTAIQNGGVSWPNKKPKTVLVTPNGKDVAFMDITPEYICKTNLPIPPEKTGFNVIASDPSADRAYWLNLDDSYLFLQPSTVVQEVKSDKKFNKLTLAGEVKDSTGSPGAAGDVLKSQGPNLPPVWGTGGGGGSNASGLPTLAPGVLTSDGTAMGWVNGMVGQFLTITNLNTYGWVDIFGSMKQNDLAGTPATGYFSRGYLQLPNDVLLQWIVGRPIYATTDIAPAKVFSDWGSFYKSTDEYAFLTVAGTDITCKYKFELPFETVFFNSVSTNVTPLVTSTTKATTTDVNANGEYKTLKVPPLTSIFSDSTIVTHAHVTLSIPVTKDKANPLLAPVIFALGKAPSGNKVDSETVIITTDSTWTVPTDIKTLTFHIVGGGAGGGEGYVNDNWNGGGAGGGSGAYKIITPSLTSDFVAGDVLTIKIGLGGSGGVYGNTDRTTGLSAGGGGGTRIYKNGAKTVYKTVAGTTMLAAGGLAPASRTNREGNVGGLGGSPGGINGGNGGSSIDNGGATATGGNGGDSPIPYAAGMYDGGGKPGKLGGTSVTVNGNPGTSYGAGGGGAAIRGKGTGPGVGGAGAKGVVIIKYTV
jgi:hypothetical protein